MKGVRVLPIVSEMHFESFKNRTNSTEGVEKGTPRQCSGLDTVLVVGRLLLFFFKDAFVSFILSLLSQFSVLEWFGSADVVETFLGLGAVFQTSCEAERQNFALP